PGLVGPGAGLRSELVPAHDLGADAVGEVAGQVVLEPAGPAGLGAAGKVRGPDGPAHQRHGVDVPEGSLEGLVLAGGDAVAGDAEVLHTHSRSHGGVL